MKIHEMSFAFSFSGEDLEEEDEGELHSKGTGDKQIKEENLAPPALHSLDELVGT